MIPTLTDDLRRAAAYHEGRALSDPEAVSVLSLALNEVVARWAALGRWLAEVETWPARPRAVPPKAPTAAAPAGEFSSTKYFGSWTKHRHISPAGKARMSAAQRARWAAYTPDQRRDMVRRIRARRFARSA